MKDISAIKEQIREEQAFLGNRINNDYPRYFNSQEILELSQKLDILIISYMIKAMNDEHSMLA